MDPESTAQALRTRRAEATERLRGLDETVVDIVEAARDSNLDDEHDTEGATIAATRAQASSLAAATRRQLAEIDEALARLESGGYGTCERCGRPVDPARLEALPATTTCIACARVAARR